MQTICMEKNVPKIARRWFHVDRNIFIDKKFNKFIKLIETYHEDSGKGYILEVDVEYPKKFNSFFTNVVKIWQVKIEMLLLHSNTL